MTKKEVIWREVLFQNRQNKIIKFTQKELAQKFGFSISTVFNALKHPRQMNIVKVSGRFFVLEDYKKLLYLWASFRGLKKDIYYKAYINEERDKIEGIMSENAIFGLYSGYKFLNNTVPADYDHVYIYLAKKDLPALLSRIADSVSDKGKLSPNFFVIEPDPWLRNYPQFLFEQIFVDIWNAHEWYAKDFLKALEEEIT